MWVKMNMNIADFLLAAEMKQKRGKEKKGEKEVISTTLKPSSLDCASIPGYLTATDGGEGNPIPPQSEI